MAIIDLNLNTSSFGLKSSVHSVVPVLPPILTIDLGEKRKSDYDRVLSAGAFGSDRDGSLCAERKK